MKEKLKETIKRVFELDSVPDNLSQENCDKWDSMSILELIVEIESDFDISFEPEEISEMKSLNEIEKVLMTKL